MECILKIGFSLAKRVRWGGVGGCHTQGDSTWRLSWLAVERPWLVTSVTPTYIISELKMVRALQPANVSPD